VPPATTTSISPVVRSIQAQKDCIYRIPVLSSSLPDDEEEDMPSAGPDHIACPHHRIDAASPQHSQLSQICAAQRKSPAAADRNLVDVTLYMLLLAQCDMGVAFLE
jgi:hypothetical protein